MNGMLVVVGRGALLAQSFCGSLALWWIIALFVNQSLETLQPAMLDAVQRTVGVLTVSFLESLMVNLGAYATALLFLPWPARTHWLTVYLRCTALFGCVYLLCFALGVTPDVLLLTGRNRRA